MAAQLVSAQNTNDSLIWYKATCVENDTMIAVNLGHAVVSNNKRYAYRYQKRYFRLERKVLKVYPYAMAAGELMNAYNDTLQSLESNRERKRYLKVAEDDLKSKFEGKIRDMTISEGLILIKLIDRETGDTSYELIKELRGSFSAFLWQGIARIFGNDLKQEYDPVEEDILIEEIVTRIENGDLKIPYRNTAEISP